MASGYGCSQWSAAVYQVLLVSALAATSQCAAATWQHKPWLTEVLRPGDNGTLRCTPVEEAGGGAHVYQFQWYSPRDQVLLGRGVLEGTGTPGTEYLLNNTGSLQLYNVQPAALGWYLCKVTHLDGNITLSKAWLVKRDTVEEVNAHMRERLLVAGIAGCSVLVALTLMCAVYKYRYREDGTDHSKPGQPLAAAGKQSEQRMSTSRLEMIVAHDYQTDTVRSSGRAAKTDPPPRQQASQQVPGSDKRGEQRQPQQNYDNPTYYYQPGADDDKYVTTIESDGDNGVTVRENQITTQL